MVLDMDKNIKLKKEFSHDVDTLRKGIRAYQRKYVYPQSLAMTFVFLLFIGFLVVKIVNNEISESLELVAYLLIVVALAFAINQWLRPVKLRESVVQSFKDSENPPIYRFKVMADKLEIEMLPDSVEDVENSDIPDTEITENGEDSEAELELVAPTVIPFDNNMSIIEKEDLFLIICGKSVYYIIPKRDFTSAELEIMRNTGKN